MKKIEMPPSAYEFVPVGTIQHLAVTGNNKAGWIRREDGFYMHIVSDPDPATWDDLDHALRTESPL